jgi:predicted small lipoprotein YifL
MKKSLMLMLGLASIVLLAGCGKNEPVEEPEQIPEQTTDQSEIIADTVDQDHLDWAKTSLTIADLEHIEETLPPLSYTYETYDMNSQSVVNSGSYKVAE